jgi:uncharacterized protein YndB with AHSA1/START domain
MNESTITPVMRDVTVPTTVSRAFEVFTTHFDSWWPRTHHIGKVDFEQAIIEPRVGGRWYERGVDGSECNWGTVLAWEPPTRVVLAWQLNGRFEYDADPARASEVEVTFRAIDNRSTVVTLEHRYLERMVAAAEAREGIGGDGGWTMILQQYAAVIAAG